MYLLVAPRPPPWHPTCPPPPAPGLQFDSDRKAPCPLCRTPLGPHLLLDPPADAAAATEGSPDKTAGADAAAAGPQRSAKVGAKQGGFHNHGKNIQCCFQCISIWSNVVSTTGLQCSAKVGAGQCKAQRGRATGRSSRAGNAEQRRSDAAAWGCLGAPPAVPALPASAAPPLGAF